VSGLDPETLEEELARYKNHLKAEQDAGRKLTERFCKAMGHFLGPWDNEVERRLKLTHVPDSSTLPKCEP
jgi:hypothetical protein